MAVYITGPDPNAATWPVNSYPAAGVNCFTTPTSYIRVGSASDGGALADNTDFTYISQAYTNAYFRINCQPFTLPVGSRVTMASPYVRFRKHNGNTKYGDFVIGIGDHSYVDGSYRDNPPWAHFTAPTYPTVRGASSPNQYDTSQGQPITALDIAKGMYVWFGLVPTYGHLVYGADIHQAYIRYTYDMPPTSNITSPASGTVMTDTNAPIITWDYFDDIQAQAKYQIQVLSGSTIVYDSGLVVSTATNHTISSNLPNGSYTIKLWVYQAWSLPGGDFATIAPSTTSFTVNMLHLATPRIVQTALNAQDHNELAVYPDVNLLDYDTSTFDRGVIGLVKNTTNLTLAVTANPVKDGAQSCKVTVTSAAAGSLTTKYNQVFVSVGDTYNAIAYAYTTLAARKVRIRLRYFDSSGNQLADTLGSQVTLVANQWNPVSITNATVPASGYSMVMVVDFTDATVLNGDVYYIDDLAIWHGGGLTRTNLATNPSLETNTTGWGAGGASPPTISQSTDFAYTSAGNTGTHSLKVVWNNSNTFFDSVGAPSFSVTAGLWYTVSAWCYSPGNNPLIAPVVGGIGLSGFGTSINAVNNGWYRVYVTFQATSTATLSCGFYPSGGSTAGQVAYIDALLIEQSNILGSYFDGTVAGGAWTGTANNSASTLSATFPTWSRGGFYEITPNLIPYADSTLENSSYTWTVDPSLNPSTSLVLDVTTARHGSTSLLLQKTTAGTGNIGVSMGTNIYTPANPSQMYRLNFSAFGTVARSTFLKVYWYRSDYSASAITTVSSATIVASTSTWADVETDVTSPADAAFFRLALEADAVAVITEKYWFDAISIYPVSASGWAAQNHGFYPGYYPNTDIAPSVLVEYSDDGGTTWKTLSQQSTKATVDHYVIEDYSFKSNITRMYRAAMLQVENGKQVNSDHSASLSITGSLRNVWLYADDGTVPSYNFTYDGGGRSRQLNASAALTPIDGRAYPFAQFDATSAGSATVSIHLDTAADVAAMEAFAGAKSTVIFRDGRGRAYRGVMGVVQMADNPTNNSQEASFTLTFAGEQP